MTEFRPRNFMLLPTMSCQGRCVYCFGPNKGPVMDERTADFALEFIARTAPEKGKIHITFHGGEPLLAPASWYRHILPQLRAQFGQRLRLSVQSNLLALSDEMLGLMQKYEIAVGTSVDGYEGMCDAQRGEGYFKKNLANRERLRQNGVPSGGICTFTPPFVTRESIGKVFHSFDSPFSLHGAVPCLGCGLTEHDLSAEEMKTLLLTSYDIYKENIADSRISTIDTMALGCFDGKGGVCTFYDCLGVFAAIASDGGVYSCQRFCGHEEYCFGNVNGGLAEAEILESTAYQKLRRQQDGTRAACGECAHYEYCMGGCLYNALAAGTDKDPYCGAYKAAYDKISLDMALEMGGVMTGRDAETPVLAMAGDRPHPYDRRVNEKNLRTALYHGKPWAEPFPAALRRTKHPENGLNKLYLHLTFDCPLRCPHCYAEGGERKTDELAAAQFASIIREAADRRFRSVVLTGGEPLVYSEFDELMSLAADIDRKGTALILRSSFGFAISDERLKAVCGLFDEIVVSVDGDRESHDARRGAGRYERTVENLERAVSLGFAERLGLCATLEKEQREGAPGASVDALAQRLKIRHVRFRPILPLGRGSGAKQESYQLCTEEIDLGERFQPRFSCGLGQNLYVEPNGDAYPCYAWCEKDALLGNLGTMNLGALLDEGALFAYGRHDVDSNKKCRVCDVRYLCGGICKAWARDKRNIDSGDFDCTARKETFTRMAGRMEKEE